MASEYAIYDKETKLQAVIVPDYGGMVKSLKVKATEILYLEEQLIESAPVMAGGIPILFPFSGKTRADTYQVDGQEYYMPMHGLLKNRTFAVKAYADNKITLWAESDKAVKHRNYPFDFHLEITYQMITGSLNIEVNITNLTDSIMPHYLGWHPYFNVPHRENAYLKHHMQLHYDYTANKSNSAPVLIDLNQDLDNVFYKPTKNQFIFGDRQAGYEVVCSMSEAYQAIVVYNRKKGAVCVEPWCGLPDSINSGRLLQWVAPNETKRYEIKLQVRLLDASG